MSRKAMVILLVLATMFAFVMVTTTASAKIGQPCPPPNSDRVCIDHDGAPDTPPIHVPPGLFKVCNDDNTKNDNKNCDKIRPPQPVCGTAPGETPPDGPVSGVLGEISAGVRSGGGGALSDALLDPVACFVESLGL